MDSFEISSDNYDPTSLNGDKTAANGPRMHLNSEERLGSGRRPAMRPGASKIDSTASRAERRTPHEQQPGNMPSIGRWKIFAGIVMIVAAAYLLIVSISYFSDGASDQSIVQGRDLSSISANSERVSNTGGPLGAYLSDLLLSRWLGIGSFVIIFYIGALGLSLVKIKHFKFWDLTYKCLLTGITLSILVGFVTIAFTSHNYWGGDHGYMVNRFLLDNTGIWGAIAVNILLVSAVALVFMHQIQSGYAAYRRRIEKHRERLARERAAAEERRRQRIRMMTPDPMGDSRVEIDEYHETPNHPFTPQPAVNQEIGGEVALEEIPDAGESTQFATSQGFRAAETERATESTHSGSNTPSQGDFSGVVKEDDRPFPIVDSSGEGGEKRRNDFSDSDSALDDDSDSQKSEFSSKQQSEGFSDENDGFSDENEGEIDLKITTAPPISEARKINTDVYDPTLELSRYRFPSIDLLTDAVQRTDHVDLVEQEENKARLTETLRTFGVKISHIEATVGPTITRYEIIPAEGVRTRSVKSLGEDLALTLQALGVRIIAPIPGKGTIGIEVPNKDPQNVYIRHVLASETFQNFKGELPIALGTTITNDVYVADLAKLPHLLVAGATGMGKSVGLNTIITSLLYKKHPAELKFVLVDPKRVELSLYRTLERHYLASLPGEDAIITDMSKVVTVLNSLCLEMENRLQLLQEAEVRNIKEYNEKFIAKRLNPLKHRFLPYIVLIIDEFADIILTQGKEVENPVSRLAAVARAAGIHLIIATQRPSVNVITGGIKTNIPGRIAFRVNQGVDSRTIIDQVGANQLNGKGDMLFSRDGVIDRVQGAFISTEEVKAVVDSVGEQIGYSEPYQLPEYVDPNSESGPARSGPLTDRDPMFEEAGRLVVNSQSGSTTMLQRKLAIGFGRAARIMDQLEIAGVVGPAQGGKPRDVLMDMIAFERYLTPPAPSD